MKPYFTSTPRLEALQRAAMGWMGTPFFLGAAIKYQAVDCVRFVAEVLVECGHLGGYDFPPYSIDGGDHLARSAVVDWLDNHPGFLRISAQNDALLTGDVVAFRICPAGVEHHVGIMLEGGFPANLMSAMNEDGVGPRTLRDRTWGKRRTHAWRPMEAEQ